MKNHAYSAGMVLLLLSMAFGLNGLAVVPALALVVYGFAAEHKETTEQN